MASFRSVWLLITSLSNDAVLGSSMAAMMSPPAEDSLIIPSGVSREAQLSAMLNLVSCDTAVSPTRTRPLEVISNILAVSLRSTSPPHGLKPLGCHKFKLPPFVRPRNQQLLKVGMDL